MTLALDSALRFHFADAQPGDWELRDDGEGPYILAWHRPEPQPSTAEIAEWDAAWQAEVASLAYREARKAEYVVELGKSLVPSFQDTTGDVLDAIIGQLALLVPEAQRTPDFAALVERVLAIKARHPKPEDAP